jgi:3,4-dihydroxy 2-butanone 4-phosphate synthase/GTP cyclohydrolase II
MSVGGCAVILDERSEDPVSVLVTPSDTITEEMVRFMADHGRGTVATTLPPERMAKLGIPLMIRDRLNLRDIGTPLGVTVDAIDVEGRTFGGRARTIRVLCAESTIPGDLSRPGHTLPIQIPAAGVLGRATAAEAAHDLVVMATRHPSATICALLSRDGSVMGAEAARGLAARNGFPAVAVQEVVTEAWRRRRVVERVVTARIPVGTDQMRIHIYFCSIDQRRLVVLEKGKVGGASGLQVHLLQYTVAGHVFKSCACGCSRALDTALTELASLSNACIVVTFGSDNVIDLGLNHDHGTAPIGFDTQTLGTVAQALRDLGPASVVFNGVSDRDARLLMQLM